MTTPTSAALPLAPIHDFGRKLRQEAYLPRLRAYVAWRRAVLEARRRGRAEPAMPPWSPLSINLDLTTACNYACDHCIDWETLNSSISYDTRRLRESLQSMRRRGLRSVILIGGGEPTVFPGFREMVRYLKDLGLHVAIVSNGSRNERILDVVDRLGVPDWVRLSLDAGTDETFQAMHHPKRPVTLEEICAWIPKIKAKNPAPRIGFSFVITWQGAPGESGTPLVENLDEIVRATRLARDNHFDYVSFKPVLVRAPDGAEVMNPDTARARHEDVIRRIRARLDEARGLATPTFTVHESTNLKLLEAGTWATWTTQPSTCHMQAFRQVLSPLGLWNCPAHRGVGKARIADREAFADAEGRKAATEGTARMLDRFDASRECREVTCLYHAANWWLEEAVASPEGLDGVPAAPGEDLFL